MWSILPNQPVEFILLIKSLVIILLLFVDILVGTLCTYPHVFHRRLFGKGLSRYLHFKISSWYLIYIAHCCTQWQIEWTSTTGKSGIVFVSNEMLRKRVVFKKAHTLGSWAFILFSNIYPHQKHCFKSNRDLRWKADFVMESLHVLVFYGDSTLFVDSDR